MYHYNSVKYFTDTATARLFICLGLVNPNESTWQLSPEALLSWCQITPAITATPPMEKCGQPHRIQ